jgi:hypothetical protein
MEGFGNGDFELSISATRELVDKWVPWFVGWLVSY